jgi:hypothetical protein
MKRLVLSLILFLFIAVNAMATCNATVSTTPVACDGQCNGTAILNPSGGTPPYTYIWNVSPPQFGQTVTGLCAGTYTCTVSDAVGCSAIRTFIVTQPSVLTGSTSNIPVSCFGMSNGTAWVTASGGNGGYSYAWSPSGQTGQTASSLSAGCYTCTIIDVLGCTATATTCVTQPPLLVAQSCSPTNISCYGGNNGCAYMCISGGTPTYTYSWSPSVGIGATACNLTAGAYSCYVTDSRGCTTSTVFTITQPSQVTAIAQTLNNVSCFNGNNGSARVTPNGGTPNYSYLWSPAGGTGQTCSSVSAGTYTVTVIDSYGCTTTSTATITQPPLLTMNASSTNASCPTCCNGIGIANGGGGVLPYTYIWSPSSVTTPSFSNMCAGNYTCFITDAIGCTTCSAVTINFNCAAPTVQASNITFSNVTTNSMKASWTNGNGSRRIVKIKTSNSFTAPVNGNDYTASTNYSGAEQVIYNGTGNTVTVIGLASSTTYWLRVYEAACSTSTSSYYTVAASGNPRARLTLPSQNPNRPENSNSVCMLDQNQPLTDGGTSERNLPGYYDGQTFIAGSDGLLCEFDLMMFNSMAGTGVMNIYAGNGITGSLLTTQIVNVYVPSGQVWQQWNINSPPIVKKDSVYTFQFVPIQGGGLPDPYGVNILGSNAYAGGYDLTFPQFDMTFKTYIDATTGINENAPSLFSIYPNPANNCIAIQLNEELKMSNLPTGQAGAELIIIDMSGRLLMQEKLDSQLSAFNLQLNSGIYFVQIRSGEKISTQKLMVE